jgi:transposase InsO family protein
MTPDKYARIKVEIRKIFEGNYGRRGYREITRVLRIKHKINHKTVQRLMREMGLYCMVRARKYQSFRGEIGQTAPNLLKRDFHADKPNEKWATDVTEFALYGKKLYLSPIMDLYNREIVSYTISRRPSFSMVSSMLDKAAVKLPTEASVILHSDQGWHYRIKRFQDKLAAYHIRQSMSRKGNCLDNAGG